MLFRSSLYAVQLSRLHTPLSEVEEIKLADDRYISGGYIESENLVNELRPEQLKKLPKTETNISELQREYLEKSIALCHENKIQLLFTILPVTYEFRDSIKNFDDCVNEVHKLANTRGIKVIDYSSKGKLQLNSLNDFLDANHLNPNGALKVSKAVLQDLTALNYLK